ncbi:MAG: 30S ribosomal protein S12 methylthiotransferase RimO [Parachlamydiaceae bacterium]
MLPISGKKKQKAEIQKPAPAKKGHKYEFGGNKIHFISLGCPRNLVDSEVMLGILLRAGYEVAEMLEDADYIVINTCGFLEASRQESMAAVEETLKTRKKTAKLIVTGCMVQTHSSPLKEKFPDINYLLGSGDLEGILEAVQSTSDGELVTNARSYLEAGEVPRQISTPKHFAYLKIAEGCRKRCAYCVIPTIKGPLKSKTEEQIVKEFKLLLDQGVKEIILIAQDLGDYAKDRGAKRSQGLIQLLKELLKVERPYWLRLLYLYPDEISPELIDLMQSDARICPYLDMPIQHVNDQVLKSMHRATSKDEITTTLTALRKAIPEISIRTSLIVGFPGETEDQFEELCQFLKEYPLDNVGIFKFSREPGSHAYDLPQQIAEEVKEDRWNRLMQIQKKQVQKLNKKMVGKTLDVVIEGYHPETKLLMVGRHRGQCPDIDGQVIINDARGVTGFGQIHKVKITDVADYDLIGSVVDNH